MFTLCPRFLLKSRRFYCSSSMFYFCPSYIYDFAFRPFYSNTVLPSCIHDVSIHTEAKFINLPLSWS